MSIEAIYYPYRQSEFEVQSALFETLKKKGYDARGEVKAVGSRLDIVIFNKQKVAICIIEAKARARIRKIPRKYKQVTRYENLFNLPVILCLNMSQVDQTIERVEEICQKGR